MLISQVKCILTKGVFVLWLCYTDQRKQEHREEFRDWPHSLLAIGTFGNSNNEIKENPSHNYHNNDENIQEDPSSTSTEEITDFTNEEIGKLQKELTKLLRKKSTNVEKEIAELPLDRFLNCPSSLEVDRRISNALCSDNNSEVDKEDENNNIEKTLSVILGRCKEIYANNNKKKSVGKKSISFLLKKMFVCTSGFAPTPSLRDTLQESRMEKVPIIFLFYLHLFHVYTFLVLLYIKDKHSKALVVVDRCDVDCDRFGVNYFCD
ncbi:hypothetical protein Lalb_Chr15g0076781 [Lupinus albus]|uniref:Uncharacterized protein n=1 Tax=Lupinus albus TaxID=3870 RepID=A0A6A4PAZ4_LUPAL|nr:hypothetical protein Lalb_Chr15g0076781 [Lupinus albus]